MEIYPLDPGLSVDVYVDCYKKLYKEEWRYLLGHNLKLDSYATYMKSLSTALCLRYIQISCYRTADQVMACKSRPGN